MLSRSSDLFFNSLDLVTIKMVENKLKIKKHASPSTVLVKFKIQGSQQEKSGIPSIHHFIFLSIFLL
jgi:hypothetical protein